MTESEFKQLEKRFEKRYFLITKTKLIVFFTTLLGSFGATWTYILSDRETGISTSVVSDNEDSTIHYSKTFIFWIPLFSEADSIREKDFNKFITAKYGGLSRWKVEGYYNGMKAVYIEEDGWNYQISLKKTDAERTSIRNIQDDILKRFFPREESYYITEIINKPNDKKYTFYLKM